MVPPVWPVRAWLSETCAGALLTGAQLILGAKKEEAEEEEGEKVEEVEGIEKEEYTILVHTIHHHLIDWRHPGPLSP